VSLEKKERKGVGTKEWTFTGKGTLRLKVHLARGVPYRCRLRELIEVNGGGGGTFWKPTPGVVLGPHGEKRWLVGGGFSRFGCAVGI